MSPRWAIRFVSLVFLFSAHLLVAPATASGQSRIPILSVPFDADLNGAPGAPNPFSASHLVKIEDVDGARGRAAHFEGDFARIEKKQPTPFERPAVIFSGANLPVRKGWIEFRFLADSPKLGATKRRRWIVALPPIVGELYFDLPESGLGLGLIQEGRDDLVLVVHRFEGGRLTADYRSMGKTTGMAAPDAELIRFSGTDTNSHRNWRRVRIGWDQDAGKVFLGVDDELRSVELDFPKTRFRALLLGIPPRILNVRTDDGFSGYLDDLVVSGPAALPIERIPKPLPPSLSSGANPQAEWSKVVEYAASRHLELILQTRRSGGWAPMVALPSGLQFLSARSVLPYSDRLDFRVGRASSVEVAMILLTGYEVLVDPRYLEVARWMGDHLVQIQNAHGTWPGQTVLTPTGGAILQYPQYAILKDRFQSLPILFLWRLADITGDARFASAAERGVKFLLEAQNPSGSWPNRVVLATGLHQSMSGIANGGELNDFATSDAMNIMLIMYRRTLDIQYLVRYLRAADWIARVFQDGRAKGWAKQYDSSDCPIPARHHEPSGVGFQEMDDVPRTLLDAYLITGSSHYREILRRWAAYVRSVRDEKGWYPFYDVQTGQPIKRVGGQMVPADPRERGDFGLTRVLEQLDRVLEDDDGKLEPRLDPAKESGRLRRRALEVTGLMDPRFGTWLTTSGPQGPVMSPSSHRVLTMLHALADAKGDSAGTRLRRVWRDEDWRNEFGHVMSSDVRLARIQPEILDRARSIILEHSVGLNTTIPHCRSGN